MKQMLYAERVALDSLFLVERPVPDPGPDEVLVRIEAVSLNYRDLAIARDGYGGYAAPLVPGSDGAGTVVTSRAAGFAPGDRVVPCYVVDWIAGPTNAAVARRRLGGPTDGVFAEHVVVPAHALVHAPPHLSPAEAATLPIAGATAWQALVADGGLQPGQTVGITGTGGVSVFAVQIARLAGALPIVVGRTEAKLAKMRALGARTVLAEPGWPAKVEADIFLDVVGDLASAIAATKIGGTVAAVGFAGTPRAELDIAAFLRRTVTLRAASGGSRASLAALGQALAAADEHPVIDRRFPFSLEGLRAALDHLANGQPFGKVVLEL